MRPRLALVPGEPAGVGPELCVRLAQRPTDAYDLITYGDAATLRRMAGLCLKRAPLAQRLRLLGVRVGALSKTGAAGVQEEVGGAASLSSRRPGGKGYLADPYTAPLF